MRDYLAKLVRKICLHASPAMAINLYAAPGEILFRPRDGENPKGGLLPKIYLLNFKDNVKEGKGDAYSASPFRCH